MSSDVVIKVENVRKKFCHNLKRSLWYGVQDIASDLNPFKRTLNGTAQLTTRSSAAPSLRKDEFWAVKDVAFELRRGQCLGLIGHNGAGKTTLLKALNGLIKPDSGRIEMRGRVGALIALGAGFTPILSGRENVYVNGAVLGMTKKEIDERIDQIIDFAELRDCIEAPVQGYSSGMAVRLGFAIAVNCKLDILLLDEVLAVGDVGFQAKCFNTLSDFRASGTAFILVSHNMHHIARYSDRVLYLKGGRVAHLGDVQTGIERFLEDMHAPESGSAGNITEWSRAYGSGRVVFKRAGFLNERGDAITLIKPGDTFSLAIDYECPSDDVDDAVLDIHIRDQDGVFFQAVSDRAGAELGHFGRSGRLLVTFEKVPANCRRLNFYFALLSRTTVEVYDWKREVALAVDGDATSSGRVFVNCRWRNEPQRELEKPRAVRSR